MKHRRLPHTDLDVSEVCLGTMTWGEQNSQADAHVQLDFAVAQGINFIDTAEMYPAPPSAATQGRTESYLGSWLAGRSDRDRLVIASKVAGPGRRDWVRGGRTDLTAANIAEAADACLQRLGLEHLDLFQIHWPQRNVPMFGQAAFRSRRREGPARAVDPRAGRGHGRRSSRQGRSATGACRTRRRGACANSAGVARELGVPGPVTVQNSYSLVSRGADGDLAEVLFREEMSLLAYSPLAGGLLTGKYRER